MQQRWSEQQLYFPPATDSVFRLIALLIAAFVVQWAAASLFYPNAGFSQPIAHIWADNALHMDAAFQPTQILTHALVAQPVSFGYSLLGLIFDCLMIYFFGSELERAWGRHNFLRFFLLGQLGGLSLGLALALLPASFFESRSYFGVDGSLAALMTAYAILWPEREARLYFFFPIKMKWLVPAMLVLTALLGSAMRVVLYCGGAVTGALFLYYYARRGRNQSTYASANAPQRVRPGLRERWDEYWRKRRLRKKQQVINQRIEMKNEVDRLLEKISRQGMNSLSRKEKAFLDRASKEF
ncbi:MAG: rhomboid family intramembrane serine protease [Leptospirales bacterium]|nr:rhomboid family intramembrane serine protease [Leptospirales bacterium]